LVEKGGRVGSFYPDSQTKQFETVIYIKSSRRKFKKVNEPLRTESDYRTADLVDASPLSDILNDCQNMLATLRSFTVSENPISGELGYLASY
jgi:hypothetical protein